VILRRRALLAAAACSAFAAPLRWPTIADDNATFNDEGTSTTGWSTSNATVGVSSGVLRYTKTVAAGTGSSATKSMTFTPSNEDYILFGKARARRGTNRIGVIWFLNGSQEVSIWFGSADASTSYTDQRVSICGYSGGTRQVIQVASGVDYETNFVEFALHYDHKFTTLNCFFKESGQWVFKGRVTSSFFSATQIQVLSTSASDNGMWVEFDHLTLAQPNIIAIGDSICAGSTLFNPDRTIGLTNDASRWMKYATLYPSLRNNLIVNKGVGSQNSTTLAGRVATDGTNHGARVVILHASTNDEIVPQVSKADRTTNIQNSINTITGAGANCVLLNALYGTSAANDNQPTPDLRDYMLDWWTNYLPTVTGHALAIDIMQPLLSAGFQNSSLTQVDGLHPTPTGYQAVGEYIRDFAGY
jgi:lysophospholipase L1-like esterase